MNQNDTPSAMPPRDDALVEISGLHFRHGNRVIFSGVDITIPRGKVTAIMGPSGTGKTTLLRLIGAQIRPQAGTVLVDGHNMHAVPRDTLFHLRKRMGMLFQTGALFTDISVFENVAFPLREHTTLPENTIRDLVLMKLQAVGLRGAHRLMPSELNFRANIYGFKALGVAHVLLEASYRDLGHMVRTFETFARDIRPKV